MSEEMKNNEVAENVESTDAGTTVDDHAADQRRQEKKYTDDDVDKIVAKKINRERERLNKLLNEEQQISELEQRERNVYLRELKADAKDALIERGLPYELASVLDYTDEDAMNKSIESIEAVFNNAVQRAVTDKLRGNVPTRGNPVGNQDQAIKNAFRP